MIWSSTFKFLVKENIKTVYIHAYFVLLQDLFKKSKETSDIANIMAQKAGTSGSPGKTKLNTKLRRGSNGSSGTDSPVGGGASAEGPSSAKKVKKEEPEVMEVDDDQVQNGDSPHNSGKTVCKYGASCYQSNPQHRSKFSHPNGGNVKVRIIRICMNGIYIK